MQSSGVSRISSAPHFHHFQPAAVGSPSRDANRCTQQLVDQNPPMLRVIFENFTT